MFAIWCFDGHQCGVQSHIVKGYQRVVQGSNLHRKMLGHCFLGCFVLSPHMVDVIPVTLQGFISENGDQKQWKIHVGFDLRGF